MRNNIPPIVDWPSASETERTAVLSRPPPPTDDFHSSVASIIAQVRDQGDDALRHLGMKYDGVWLDNLEVSPVEWAQAESVVDPGVLDAMIEAIARINAFHTAGKPKSLSMETAGGLLCEARYLPISPVGLYVPGGSAPLISTVIMLAIPARIAACEQVIMCTPPDGEGQVNPAILVAARLCGVNRVFKTGGAQAIAAMGLGTGSMPRCAKLFGPGNAWVTQAKQQIANMPGGAARDMPAGPSEVLVIADETADVRSVCWDLLSQAEHGPDSQVLVVSDSMDLLDQVSKLIPAMAAALPRAAILDESLQHLGRIWVKSSAQAMEISNRYAPEHLILNCRDANRLVDDVCAAGSVFIGPWTPESLGDYCSGTNHVLPTSGYARAYSGLSVNDYLRRMTLQRASREGLCTAGPAAATLADAEGLDAHRMAVEYRLELARDSR